MTTVGQMGVYVHLLMDMRDTLDRFQPSVFVFDQSSSPAVARRQLALNFGRVQQVEALRQVGLGRTFALAGSGPGGTAEEIELPDL